MYYVREGILNSLPEFEREYIDPIIQGLHSDCTDSAKRLSIRKSTSLYQMLKPYVNRKDAKILLRDLPPLQQVVLTIGPR